MVRLYLQKGAMIVPQRRSAVKALRQNDARHTHNLDIRTDLKKTIKKFFASLKDKDLSHAKANLNLVYKKLDKAAKKNLLHKNTVARRKAHFSRRLAGLTAASQA